MLTKEQIQGYRDQYGVGKGIKSNVDRFPSGFAKVKEAAGDVVGIGKDIYESSKRRGANITESRRALKRGEQSKLATRFQVEGEKAAAGADAIGAVFKGLANVALSDKAEKNITKVIQSIGNEAAQQPVVQNAVSWYANLDPVQQRNFDASVGIVSLATEIGTAGLSKSVKEPIVRGFKSTLSKFPNIRPIQSRGPAGATSGIGQTVTEFGERFPRAIKNVQENVAEAGVRAQRIAEATPPVKQAIKSGLNENVINKITTVADAGDTKTLTDLRKMVDLAENPSNRQRPSIIAGEASGSQAEKIINQKQAIGAQIGAKAKELSATQQINTSGYRKNLENILKDNDINITRSVNEAGNVEVKLGFGRSAYTPKEQTLIKDLFKQMSIAGDEVTPSVVYNKDRLFSKLQREARFEGLGNIIVDTPDGSKNLFQAFRDVYSKTLDDISPEIKNLNREYAQLSSFVDQMERTIIKQPGYVKSDNVAEFAKVNLKRILGESQSQAAFLEIADQMDDLARKLGYDGAKPTDLIEFAEDLKRIYPETIPKGGFAGGIRLGIGDVIEKVSNFGKPGVKDQQRALRELLDSYVLTD